MFNQLIRFSGWAVWQSWGWVCFSGSGQYGSRGGGCVSPVLGSMAVVGVGVFFASAESVAGMNFGDALCTCSAWGDTVC